MCRVRQESEMGRLLSVPAPGCAGDLGEPTLRRLLLVLVVPVPPHVRRGVGVAPGRVLPLLLTTGRRHVQVPPGAAPPLVAAGADAVGAGHLAVVITDGRSLAVPRARTQAG